MITVACVWVQANVPYSLDYVRKLRTLVKRHLQFDHEFVCLTDQPEIVRSHVDRTIGVSHDGRVPGWWAKLQLFNPQHEFRDRVMYLDLDTLPVGSLDAIAGYDAPFALIPHAGNFTPRDGRRTVPCYNSSVMVWDDAPRMHKLWSDWRPEADALRLWGDQDYIAERMPIEKTMPLEWFPRLSELIKQERVTKHKLEPAVPHGVSVILCKKPKNHEAAQLYPWFNKWWS